MGRFSPFRNNHIPIGSLGQTTQISNHHAGDPLMRVVCEVWTHREEGNGLRFVRGGTTRARNTWSASGTVQFVEIKERGRRDPPGR